VLLRTGALIAACALLPGAVSPDATDPRLESTVVQYASGLGLDRQQSPGAAADSPVVVLVHGCCGDRRDLGALARALARRGAVVLNADVHRLGAGGGWPASYLDVVCALAEARVVADEGDGRRPVVLVGWADGALLGAAVTLGGRQMAQRATGCVRSAVDVAPDLFVGIGGHYGWPGGEPPAELVNPRTVEWFGGTPAADPVAWEQGNPQWWLGQPGRQHPPPIALIGGVGDEATRDFAGALRAHRLEVSQHAVRNEGNLALSQPRGVSGAGVLSHLCRILGLPLEPWH
jgi:hypothetical protein